MPTSQIESSHEPEISPQRYIKAITLHPDVGGVTPDKWRVVVAKETGEELTGYGSVFRLPFQFGFGLIVN